MTRAYIRVDPAFYERKLDQGYPVGAIGALAGCLCLGELQSERGHFRSIPILKALLGPGARYVPFLLEQHDLVTLPNGRIYIEGWREWQEGDVTVKERMARIRNRTNGKVTGKTVTDTVSNPSLAGRGGAVSGAGQPIRNTDNCYRLFHDRTGEAPSDKETRWIDDLVKDFTRPVVAQAIFEDSGARGCLSRVSRKLRSGA